ncbi:hypothetical protein ACJA88_014994 [Fusarium oxysporum]
MSNAKRTSLYQDLSDGEIRIFRLFEGAKDDLLKGEFIIRQLSQNRANDTQAPQYDALSYVWGGEPNPRDGFQVLINNNLVYITQSLYSFLDRLRLPAQPRLLWIDAICIDQSDLGELGDQVRLMPSIYSTARRVFVDLGQETDDSHKALKLLNLAWNKHIWTGMFNQAGWTAEEIAFWIGVDLPSDEERRKSQMVMLPSCGDQQWESVARFFSRPWFSRLWIIQEFVVARELILFHGTQHIKWQELFGAVHSPVASFKSNPAYTRGFFAYFCMGSIRRVKALTRTPEGAQFLERRSSIFALRRFDRIQLSDLVHFFQSSQSKRKRDRYFALVGIADDVGNEKKLQPDYKSSLDDIITRFGEVMIQKEHGGEVLLRAGLWQQHSSAVPSWIPDYARQDDVLNFIQPRTFGPIYAAAGNSVYRVSTLTERKDTIVLRGALIDLIKQKPFTSSLGKLGEEDIQPEFATLEHHSLSLKSLIGTTTQSCYLQTGGSIFDAIAITLICGLKEWDDVKRIRAGFNCFSWMAVARDNRTMQADQWIYKRITKHFGIQWNEVYPQYKEYRDRVALSIRAGCFKPGDQIWVIQGVAMPLVLRKSNVNQDCFQLIGCCYLHGWMNGEALRSLRCEFRQVAIC